MLIAIKRADGGVSVMNIIEPEKLKKADRKKLIEGEVGKWAERHAGQYVSHREVEPEALPQDRAFRDAWTDDNPTRTVDVDMDKARAIHMDRLRKARNEKLSALDLKALRAVEAEDRDALKEIAAAKQALRDMPMNTDLSAIGTPEELAAFEPEVLKGGA